MTRRRRQFGEIEQRPSRVPGRAPRYRARYPGPDGIRYDAPFTFDTIGDADGWLAQVQRDIRLGLWSPTTHAAQPANATPTRSRPYVFSNFAEACITNRMRRPVKPLRPSTAANYRKQLRLELLPTFGSKRIDRITEDDVNAWHAASSAKGHPTQTANAYLFLSSVMSEAVQAGLISVNPCRVPGAKGKPVPRHEAETLTIPELREYLDAVPQMYRLPLMLAALCGLRSGEVRGLRLRDVDLASGRITVAQAVSRIDGQYLIGKPKSRAALRTVYAPELLRQALAEYVSHRRANSRETLLFTARDGVSPLHSTVLREAHLKGREAINRPSLTVHDLRKTSATLAAQQGATVKEIMAMLGHTTPTVAMIYQSAAERRMQEIATRLGDGLTLA